MKQKLGLILLIIIIFISIFVSFTNKNTLDRINKNQEYERDNGKILLSSIISTLSTWNNQYRDMSDNYYKSLEKTKNFISSHTINQVLVDEKSKNNQLYTNKTKLSDLKYSFWANTFIFMPDISCIFVSYNDLFWKTHQYSTFQLLNDDGVILSREPGFITTRSDWLIKNSELYFFGVSDELLTSYQLKVMTHDIDGNFISEFYIKFQKKN